MNEESEPKPDTPVSYTTPDAKAVQSTDRPRGKPSSPVVNYPELDRLLVEGELIDTGDGKKLRSYPSHGQLALRYGCTKALVTMYSTKRNCKVRRAAFEAKQQREEVMAEQAAIKAQGVNALPPPEQGRIEEGYLRRGGKRVIPWDIIDGLLVMGEPVTDQDGITRVYYPTATEIARRYSISISTITTYAKQQNCAHRRAEHQTRVAIRTEEKVIQMTAEAQALSRADLIKLTDEYFQKFGRKLKEGAVRVDNPADFNTMVRLWEFIQGNADSRTEVKGMVTLEAVQQRYAQVSKARVIAPEDSGIVVDESPLRIDRVGDGMCEPAALPEGSEG